MNYWNALALGFLIVLALSRITHTATNTVCSKLDELKEELRDIKSHLEDK